ncbi:putative porin [Polaribacter vadi]|uniref:putative porin n=1 Tax=Polaribacter TaxID=52959 RepID=UPI001C09458A|nr:MULTISPECIES: putative porin [Polaribacter]MBU3010395.1 putative porin [Polaribacter vadi]MDO6740203.1 putative porin [Polaribacter sp. 1_MG-2023]
MNKTFFYIFLLLICSNNLFGQRLKEQIEGGSFGNSRNDTINNSNETKVILSGKTKYTDYKIFSHKRDTSYIDTTLTLQKEYKFNYLRKDNFELLEFHNQGQTFNNLGYSFDNVSQFPDIGFSAKQFSYLDVEDIKYYEVPTPTTEILYRTGLQQGQVVDALFTLNFSKRLNVSLSYKGLRSLGEYRQSLVSNGNFRGAFHYRTKENQYEIRGHLTSQDFFHEESGGLTADALDYFVTEDPDFTQRSRLDVNLEDAESQFDGTRVYVEHSYKILSSKDTINDKDFTNLKVGHVFTSENKFYSFNQTSTTTDIFGSANASDATNNEAKSSITNNELNLEFNSKYVLGKFKAKANLINYSYGYDTILNTSSSINKLKLEGSAISVGADWNARIKNFQLNADAALTPGSGRLSGSHLQGEAVYLKDSLFGLKGSLLLSSKSPNFNTLLHQSKYDDYNWQNDFSNVNTRDLGFAFTSKLINANLNFTNIDNYTYFDESNLPQQYGSQITYLKVKANREFKFWKLGLDNTVMYQNVTSGAEVFRVPEFVTRNTLYYTDEWFKGKPMLVNIGVTFKYFTKYNANAYNPLLAEFTLQNTDEIGYPTFDVFFNARVRRTRIYFKIDNVTSSFSEKNYFSAPNYPYRDFTIRFGLVWNWFI